MRVCMHVYTLTNMHTHTHTHSQFRGLLVTQNSKSFSLLTQKRELVSMCMYVCMYVCMYMHILTSDPEIELGSIYVCMGFCLFVCYVRVCMYMCVYVCMYVLLYQLLMFFYYTYAFLFLFIHTYTHTYIHTSISFYSQKRHRSKFFILATDGIWVKLRSQIYFVILANDNFLL